VTEPGQSVAGKTCRPTTAEEEALALRLRVAELEARLAEADARLGVVDATYSSGVWRVLRRGSNIRRALGPAGAVAAGFDGSGSGGVSVPLAGLRHSARSPASISWTDEIDVGGVVLGGVHADPPTTLTYAICGRAAACVRAFVALRPGAWMANRGGVRFRILLEDRNGRVLAAVQRDVAPSARSADRGWVPMTLPLPPLEDGAHELTMATELPPGATPEYSWAVWGDPVLLVAATGGAVRPLPSRGDRMKMAVSALRRPSGPSGAVEHGDQPLISLLLPVHDPKPEWLQETLNSVFAQTSRKWELCVVDDGSSRPEVADILRRAALDERVKLRRLDTAEGISAATNAALALARGSFVATLDHDDVLAPHAIAAVGERLSAEPTVDVLYTDNDKIAGGQRFSPSLKPGWSPELARACMYTLHLSVYRRELVEEVGGWRSAFDGAQDHDLLLRVSERTERIGHLPDTLYSWRAHAGSAALGEHAKPQAYNRGAKAVEDHLRRKGIAARVEPLAVAGRFRVVYEPMTAERIAVVLPLPARLGAAPDLADQLMRVAVALHDGRALRPQIVVAATERTVAPARAIADRATIVAGEGDTWGALARSVRSTIDAAALVLIEDLCAPSSPDWLEELAGPIGDPKVCASSPLVLDDEGRVVHAGIALLRGLPLPVYAGADTTADEVSAELTMVTDRSAAAGVVALTSATLARGGGLDERSDRLALCSLTARLTSRGGRIVCSPHVPWKLIGEAPCNALDEVRAFALQHRDRADAFYNPRLWPDRAAHIIPRALHQTRLRSDLGTP
jgi:Glycosyl transferase family 2